MVTTESVRSPDGPAQCSICEKPLSGVFALIHDEPSGVNVCDTCIDELSSELEQFKLRKAVFAIIRDDQEGRAAQGIEARRAETVEQDSVHESPGRCKRCAGTWSVH